MCNFCNIFIKRKKKLNFKSSNIFSIIPEVTYKKWHTDSHQFPGAITIETVKSFPICLIPWRGPAQTIPSSKMMMVRVRGTSREHEWTWGHSLHLGTILVSFYITIILFFLNGLTRVAFMIGLTFALSHWSVVRLVFFRS